MESFSQDLYATFNDFIKDIERVRDEYDDQLHELIEHPDSEMEENYKRKIKKLKKQLRKAHIPELDDMPEGAVPMWVMPITPDINTEERLLQFRRQYKGHLTYEDGWRIVSRLRKIRARPPTTPAPAQPPEEDISSDVSLSSTSSD